MRFFPLLTTALSLAVSDALSISGRGGRPFDILLEPENRDLLQDIITWDEHSLFIHGERAMIFSGEVHPFRLPVPSLYLDVFQKIKALGFNMVSFYVDWALLEGKPGEFRADGIFDLEPFFDAASEAGIYLLARPGPYINAEASGGGFPGWLQRVEGLLRTSAPDFLEATDNYMANICKIIAKAQITNGGPVILFQPENEYSMAADGVKFPDKEFFQYVIDQAHDAGIVVPMISNDAFTGGTSAPGTGLGEVDIYGHDGYPVGFDCANPYTWPEDGLPTTWHAEHLRISPNTPYSLIEFQGGAFDPYGGWGFEQCSILVNQEFERVFYKNNYAAGVTIFNIYMTFGGTNWGNLGHPGGYTSYDYGASIREDRAVDREKYSELKLQGQFMKVSPGYVVTNPGNLTTGVYSPSEGIVVTPLLSNKTGSFFVVRQSDYTSTLSTDYTLKLPTSAGKLTIPQLGGELSLNGRDSKIHVTDYPVGEHGEYSLLYSTAEVFTWKKFHDKTVLILYGGPDELHEVAVKGKAFKEFKEVNSDSKITIDKKLYGDAVVFQWETSPTRQIAQMGDLYIYLLDRNSAYKYWVPVVPSKENEIPAVGSSVMNPEAVIVNGGYLIRSVAVEGRTLSFQADFNTTKSDLEIIGAPKSVSKLVINGEEHKYKKNKLGNWVTQPRIELPKVKVPDLSALEWKYIDSLPEVHSDYDDSAWTDADISPTKNSLVPLRTPTSLYGSDYGFNTGTLVFRGHFTAKGTESQFKLQTQGGEAHASAVWLNGDFVGSFAGYDAGINHNATYTLPNLTKDKKYVFTVLVDNTGLHENWTPGLEEMKQPRGILDYELLSDGNKTTEITDWKITGNLGGEDYIDKFRGPLNEGGLYFERKGYHLPSPPLGQFESRSPFDGSALDEAGVAYFTTKLSLDIPSQHYDVPLSFVFENSTVADNADAVPAYRAILYVNGFQYGKYFSNVGPQTEFPVPEGIWNYHGENWIGLALWALDEGGLVLPGLTLEAGKPVLTGREKVVLVEGPKYKKRKGAY